MEVSLSMEGNPREGSSTTELAVSTLQEDYQVCLSEFSGFSVPHLSNTSLALSVPSSPLSLRISLVAGRYFSTVSMRMQSFLIRGLNLCSVN